MCRIIKYPVCFGLVLSFVRLAFGLGFVSLALVLGFVRLAFGLGFVSLALGLDLSYVY